MRSNGLDHLRHVIFKCAYVALDLFNPLMTQVIDLARDFPQIVDCIDLSVSGFVVLMWSAGEVL